MKSFMEIAFSEAKIALLKNEVPIGAIITNRKGQIFAKSRNKNRELNDPTAHAEILAIRKACKKIKSNKLIGYSIYVTLQPCEMCLHAILNTRISYLYYGASDLANISLQEKYVAISENKKFNIEIYSGINEKKCSDLLINFFKTKRIRLN
tara:strand:- start:2246 stop:2698 length:453 start_codon:yes stop_codon:yes gene_type:complete